MVDLARENWNFIFEHLVILFERLEELDIETITNDWERAPKAISWSLQLAACHSPHAA